MGVRLLGDLSFFAFGAVVVYHFNAPYVKWFVVYGSFKWAWATWEKGQLGDFFNLVSFLVGAVAAEWSMRLSLRWWECRYAKVDNLGRYRLLWTTEYAAIGMAVVKRACATTKNLRPAFRPASSKP